MQLLWECSDWAGGRIDQQVTYLSWICISDDGRQGYLAGGSQSNSIGIVSTDIDPSLPFVGKTGLNWSSKVSSRSKSGDEDPDAAGTAAKPDDSNTECLDAETDQEIANNQAPSTSTAAAASATTGNRLLNYNLRGHRFPINIVEWNRQHKRLATCDESGVCYVWISYEDRWSVELVNDRNCKISDFTWSPTCELALICYSDSFVLVGSVGGQRIWSHSIDQSKVLCGAWMPDEKGVVLGCENGSLMVISDQGAVVEEHKLADNKKIEKLAWSVVRSSDASSVLCACIEGGILHFKRAYDDPDPSIYETGLEVVRIQWSQGGHYLGCLGTTETAVVVQIFDIDANLLVNSIVPISVPFEKTMWCSFCWGYDDQRVFVSVGCEIFVGCVFGDVCTLRTLSSYHLWQMLKQKQLVNQLPVPVSDKQMITDHALHTIQCPVLESEEIISCVCTPTQSRWYCTILPEPSLSTQFTNTFTLCTEHLGGLVPVLRGRQITKFRPEFEIRIYRPPPIGVSGGATAESTPRKQSEQSRDAASAEPTSARDEVCRSAHSTPQHYKATNESNFLRRGSAKMTSLSKSGDVNFSRDNVWRRSKRQIQQMMLKAQQQFNTKMKERKLVQVQYKTSVLHLQPRQMSISLVDLSATGKGFSARTPTAPVDVESEEPEDSAFDTSLLPRLMDEGPPVAPLPSEIFGGPPAYADVGGQLPPSYNDVTIHLDDVMDKGKHQSLAAEMEERLLTQVLKDFEDLKIAVDRHITRMRDFAQNLERSNQPLAAAASLTIPGIMAVSTGGTTIPDDTNRQVITNALDQLDDRISEAERSKQQSTTTQTEHNTLMLPITTTCSSEESVSAAAAITGASKQRWEDLLSNLKYIDEDEATTPQNQTLASPVDSSIHSSDMRTCASSTFDDQDSKSLLTSTQQDSAVTSAVATGPPPPQCGGMFAHRQTSNGSTPIKTKNYKQLREIASILDKMYKVAAELTPRRLPDGSTIAYTSVHQQSRICPSNHHGVLSSVAYEQDPTIDDDRPAYADIYLRLGELSKRVGQLESRLSYGNDLLDDIRRDLHQRVSNIRRTLSSKQPMMTRDITAKEQLSIPTLTIENGDDSCSIGKEKDASPRQAKSDDGDAALLELTNKSPFWNEASQVYQLDFGGRVTQESAKNFQIEFNGQQVMQFGRIEHSAYTLDFEQPFSPVQAFATALASITQRLK